jgi:hypothetical protein
VGQYVRGQRLRKHCSGVGNCGDRFLIADGELSLCIKAKAGNEKDKEEGLSKLTRMKMFHKLPLIAAPRPVRQGI